MRFGADRKDGRPSSGPMTGLKKAKVGKIQGESDTRMLLENFNSGERLSRSTRSQRRAASLPGL